MALRMGELMVVIRAQDFASRTLRRVGGEFAGMSRLQAQALQTSQRLANDRGELRRLQIIQKNIDLTNAATAAQQRLEHVRRIAQTGRDPMGRFMSTADINTARSNLLRLQGEVTRLNQAQAVQQTLVKQLPHRYQLLDKKAADVAERMGTLNNRIRDGTRELNVLNRAIPFDRLDNFGRALSGIGRTMQLFGAISTVAFGAAAKQAADFATEATNAATQMRDITVQTREQGLNQIEQRTNQLTNGLRQNGVEIGGVLDLMQQYPASANEMSASAYDIFSSMQLQKNGITDVAAGMSLLETANKIAVAGNVDLGTATNTMVTTLNNFARQGEDTTEVLDTMFDIVRFGRMRLSDFDVMMNKIAPAAAGAGQSLEDVGGAMAFLTEVMPSQRMVATGISRLIEAFERPEIVEGLHKAGIEAENAAGKLRPLPELLSEIHDKLDPRNAAEFFRLISAAGRGGGRGVIFTQEGRRAFNQIMNNFDAYLERQDQIEKNTGEFGTALEANLKSIGYQWKIFTNQVRVLVLVVGKEAVPVFAIIGQHIESLVQWFTALDPEIRSQIVRWGVLIGVGTLFAGVVTTIIGAITTMVARFGLIIRLATITTSSLTGVSGSIAGILRLGPGLTAMLGLVVSALTRIAAFSVIPLTLWVAWKGDATAIDFLLGALGGAALGARFGPAGMILGAVTVPVILSLIVEKRKSGMEKAFDAYEKEIGPRFNELGGYGAFALAEKFNNKLPSMLRPFSPRFDRENFEKDWNRLLEHHRKVTKIIERAPDNKTARFYIRNLKDELDGINPIIRDLFEKFGPKRQTQKQALDWFAQMRQQIKNGTKEQKTFLDELEKWYKVQLDGADSTIDRQKQLADVTKQATDQVLSSARNMYTQLRQVNEQAMGALFQGPWLTSETFDLAKEWGITPRIEDMILDLKQQNRRFAEWRQSLDKLFKRGLPPELVNELRQMGPEEGQAFVDNLLKAKPGQVQAIIQQWKIRNKQIEDATKMDFTDQIESFRKAGVNMGEALINGFQDAKVAQWFDAWITRNFPEVINSAVTNARNEFKQANPPGANKNKIPIPKPSPTQGNTNNTTNNNKHETTNVTVVAPPHTDSADQARQAAFVLRNRNR